MTKASDNKFPGIILQEAANDGSDFSNPDADYRRVFLGEDGQLHAKDSSGTVTDIGSGSVAALDDVGDVNAPTPSDGDVLTWDSTPGEWIAAAPSGGSGGGILGAVQYTVAAVTQSSASIADIDATNFKVTFTAPASGKVFVTMTVECKVSGSGGGMTLGIRESTTTVAGLTHVLFWNVASHVGTVTKSWLITGISAGSHTYKGAYGSDGFNTNGIENTSATIVVQEVP